MKIGMVAGEASGDTLGAALILAFKKSYPHVEIVGLGGQQMIAAGCNSLFDIERLSVMGFIEPLKRLPDLLKLRRALHQYFINNPPDVFIGIDAPDFNIGLELKLKRAGIKTVHYVSPSVWAWRAYRLKKIKQAVDLMLTLFPFETAFYQAHHVPAVCVGHPLADSIPIAPEVTAPVLQSLNLDTQPRYLAILPGSRTQEIQLNGEPFLLAAKKLWEASPTLQFLTTHVNQTRCDLFRQMQQRLAPGLPIHYFVNRTRDVIAASEAVMVTSGTATLEVMLHKKPMVIGYKMSFITNLLAKLLVKTPYAGLPNIIAGKRLVPELIQSALTPDAIAAAIQAYLNQPETVQALIKAYTEYHLELKMDSAARAVEAVMKMNV